MTSRTLTGWLRVFLTGTLIDSSKRNEKIKARLLRFLFFSYSCFRFSVQKEKVLNRPPLLTFRLFSSSLKKKASFSCRRCSRHVVSFRLITNTRSRRTHRHFHGQRIDRKPSGRLTWRRLHQKGRKAPKTRGRIRLKGVGVRLGVIMVIRKSLYWDKRLKVAQQYIQMR